MSEKEKKLESLSKLLVELVDVESTLSGIIHKLTLLLIPAAETYKLNCYCSNCRADNIKVELSKGLRADVWLEQQQCPKCKCRGVKRDPATSCGINKRLRKGNDERKESS